MIIKEKKLQNTNRNIKMNIIKKDFRANKAVYFLFIPVLVYYIVFH